MPPKQTFGSRAQVMHGNAKKTSGGLTKSQLKYNKQGKIVSKKASALAKKNNRLVKAGYVTKKGQFGVSMRGGITYPVYQAVKLQSCENICGNNLTKKSIFFSRTCTINNKVSNCKKYRKILKQQQPHENISKITNMHILIEYLKLKLPSDKVYIMNSKGLKDIINKSEPIGRGWGGEVYKGKIQSISDDDLIIKIAHYIMAAVM